MVQSRTFPMTLRPLKGSSYGLKIYIKKNILRSNHGNSLLVVPITRNLFNLPQASEITSTVNSNWDRLKITI